MKPSQVRPQGQIRNNFIGIVALILILLAGYFLFREEKKTVKLEIESELNWVLDSSLQANKIPFIPQIQTLGVFSYEEEIMKYDWDWDTMSYILKCESGGNERAVGDKNTKHHSYGLLQIRNLPERNLNVDELFIPERNIEIAYKIWQEQGYRAWKICYTRYLSTLK